MASVFDQDNLIGPELLREYGYKVTEKDGFWWAEGKFGNEYGEIISGNLNIPETDYPMLYTRKDKYMIETLTDLEVLTNGLSK